MKSKIYAHHAKFDPNVCREFLQMINPWETLEIMGREFLQINNPWETLEMTGIPTN